MNQNDVRDMIEAGRTTLGIEFGSTRIKAILIDPSHAPLASGSYEWENRFEDGIWTYPLDAVWTGLQACYQQIRQAVETQFGVPLRTIGAIGFSGMMHGYLVFDAHDALLVPFRTWRNTMTGQAADELTRLFQFNIPQRWSIAHLYQAMLNGEPHVPDIRFMVTLAGYVHWKLTGRRVLGIGEASGMFPIDTAARDYDARMIDQFDALLRGRGIPWGVRDILPGVLVAGDPAGTLTEDGARLLDPTGQLAAGIPLCPPEGDAGTGMVATNSVAPRTGNVSAGTSVFAMIVLEKPLSAVHAEIDLVTTPSGSAVAMVHSNNCTSDINDWVELFGEFSRALGLEISPSSLYTLLYQQALSGDDDGGGMLAFNTLSGEHLIHLEEGRPLFARTPESRFTLPNFMRTHLFAALAPLRIGLDVLFEEEHVTIDRIFGHGGFFKTREVGQRMMAAAMHVPVSVMESAGEGGAWGIAVLASFMLNRTPGESLESWLAKAVFTGGGELTVNPVQADVDGFTAFMARYRRGLAVERAAVDALRIGTHQTGTGE
jgi:sugar (pentulose or hexulose) kinase